MAEFHLADSVSNIYVCSEKTNKQKNQANLLSPNIAFLANYLMFFTRPQNLNIIRSS